MWKVDRTGQFRFSDKTGFNQTFLLDYDNEPSWVPEAAKTIYLKFRGKTVSVEKVYEYLITETQFLKRTNPLKQLEKESKISKIQRPEGSKRGFPEGSVITFAP